MDGINYVLLIGAGLMFAGIVLGASSSRFGIPFLLIFLAIGMLAGVDGPGAIQFDNYYLSFFIGNLALAVILLDGGLRTKMATFRVALKPALSLATLGVLATASLVALCASRILDLDWKMALLLGTIVGSTDAAAVFSLLRSSGIRLNERISSTLEIESGINDPMAVFLTIALIEVLTKGQEPTVQDLMLRLLQQFAIGTVVGIASGFLLSEIFKRIQVSEGLNALFLCSGGVAAFSLANISGGSGFLAVYLAGLTVGNYRRRVGEDVLRAMDGMAWLGQSGMFLLLGLLVTPQEILANVGPASGVALFLMLVARPVAVVLCILPFRFNAREVLFISWVGLRGAVPIIMAIFPLLAGVDFAGLIFNVAFMVVLMSLVVQGTTIPPAARWLKVDIPGKAEPIARMQLKGTAGEQVEFVQFSVPGDASVIGIPLGDFLLPQACRVAGIVRGGRSHAPGEIDSLMEGDVISLIAPQEAIDHLSEMFHHRQHPPGARKFYGDFLFEGSAMLGDVATMYGEVTRDSALQALTLDQAIRTKLHRYAVQGDSVLLAGLLFTVRTVRDGLVVKVGMKLPERNPPDKRFFRNIGK